MNQNDIDPMPSAAAPPPVEFAYNPEPRCACVLLLDASGSMGGEPVRSLNDGVRQYVEELIMDPVASLRVETAVVSFSSRPAVETDFASCVDIGDVKIKAGGVTNMAPAIERALDMIRDRKAQYRAAGVDYYRPWIILITDGEPTDNPDDLNRAAARLRREEQAKNVAFFCVGVGDANMTILNQIGHRSALPLKGLAFDRFFKWLSASMRNVSASQTDDEIRLSKDFDWAVL